MVVSGGGWSHEEVEQLKSSPPLRGMGPQVHTYPYLLSLHQVSAAHGCWARPALRPPERATRAVLPGDLGPVTRESEPEDSQPSS